MKSSKFNFPNEIFLAAGASKKIVESFKLKNILRPLIVTDRGVAKLSILQEFQAFLIQNLLQASVFSEIWGNPNTDQVLAGVDTYKQSNCDAIIAFGGGAAMDVAKLIALKIHHPEDLLAYEDSESHPIDKEIPPIFAIPTTAGTGSEVGRCSVVSDAKTHVKKIICSPRLLPEQVFVDPLLTMELPPLQTAATGMDALTHLIEAYLVPDFHPMCDGIALEGIRLVAQNISPAFAYSKAPKMEDAKQIECRSLMMNAAYMGAVAFQKGLGVTHSCAHALSTVCDMHHGLANAVMLPFCLEFNFPEAKEKFQRMAHTAGLPNSTGENFIGWVIELNKALEIPRQLKELGVKKEQILELTEHAFNDVCHQTNPRKVSKENITTIFAKAIG